MTAFLLLAGGLTCIFFLYVLAQFHKELRRRELHNPLERGHRGLHSPNPRFRPRGKTRKSHFEPRATSSRVPLAETTVNVKLLVPRDT